MRITISNINNVSKSTTWTKIKKKYALKPFLLYCTLQTNATRCSYLTTQQRLSPKTVLICKRNLTLNIFFSVWHFHFDILLQYCFFFLSKILHPLYFDFKNYFILNSVHIFFSPKDNHFADGRARKSREIL